MDKEKESISEVVFPIIKGQFVTCTENQCNRCYENSKGSCSSALTANEIEIALINAGYGNIEQAVREFATDIIELLDEMGMERSSEYNDGYDDGVADCITNIKSRIKERFGN